MQPKVNSLGELMKYHLVSYKPQTNEVIIIMKFVNLRIRTGESVKTMALNVDAIQSVEQLRTAFPHELDAQQLSAPHAVMAYDSYKGQSICNVRYPHSNIVEYIPVDEDCQAVYLITLKNGDVYICQDGDMPVAFAELLGF